MMPNLSAPKIEPLAEAEAGFDYFATAAHCQSVAGRILAALAGGGRFVLVTGNPPANGRELANALGKAAAGTHTVIGIPCGDGVTRDDWRRLVPTPSGEIEAQEFSAGALLVALGTPLPLYVLEEADQLSDEQLREFFATWLFGEPTIGMAVLVVTPAFLGRLERPSLSFLIEGLAARILFQHLGPDEIAPFVRQQLLPGDPPPNLSPDTIATIAAASGGDPILVNKLAFRARATPKVSTAPLTPSMAARTSVEDTEAVATGDEEATSATAVAASLAPLTQAASEPLADGKPRARLGTMRRRLVIGGIFVVAYMGILLVLGTLIPKHFRLVETPPEAVETPLASQPTKERQSSTASDVLPLAPKAESPAATKPSAEMPKASPEVPAQQNAAASPAHTESPAASHATVEDKASAVAPSTGASPTPIGAANRGEAAKPAPAASATLPADDIAALIARGDALLSTGDIVSARLYYERAANAGDSHAALLMAETFDPSILERAGVRGVRGDQKAAETWYQRARELGNADAERHLQMLNQQK